MANDEHVALLKQGVDAWNTWRLKNAGTRPNLSEAKLIEADLRGADLSSANLIGANLVLADLRGADLIKADLTGANLTEADLTGTDFTGAKLIKADLTGANLTGANLTGADLHGAALLDTDLTDANLTGCRVYGVSAWNLKLDRTKQQNLLITRRNEPEITVDNIEVAQFIYLMLHSEKIRDVKPSERRACSCWAALPMAGLRF